MAGILDVLFNALGAAANTFQNGGSVQEAKQNVQQAAQQTWTPQAAQMQNPSWGDYVQQSRPQQQAVIEQPIVSAPAETWRTQSGDSQQSSGGSKKETQKKKETESTFAPGTTASNNKKGPFEISMESVLNNSADANATTPFSSGGGKWSITPDEYKEASIRAMSGDKEAQDIVDQFRQQEADKMGEAAGMATPVGAGFRGAMAGIKANKAAKAAKKAEKLEQKAAKAAEKAGISTTEEAAKAGEEAAKNAEAIKNAKPANRSKANQKRVDKMLTNENGYFGTAAKNTLADKVGKPLTKEDLAVPAVLGSSALGAMGVAALADPEFMERPFAETLANGLNENGGYGFAYTMNPNWESPEKPKPNPEDGDTLADEESFAPGRGPIDPSELIYGLDRADYMGKSQRDQFLAAMQDEAMKQYYEDTYGADLTDQDFGYERFKDLGESTNYMDKYNLVRDLFGYENDNKETHGIEGWQNLAANSGIDLSGSDEQDINNILEYMWGAENIINPYDYFTKEDYSGSKNLSNTSTSAEMLADYILNQYMDIDRFAEAGLLGDLDSKDIAAMVAAGNLMNNGLGTGFGESDMLDLTNMLGYGGDQASFNFTDDAEKGFKWNADKNRSYNAANIYNALVGALQVYNEAMANGGIMPNGIPVAEVAPDPNYFTAYNGEGVSSAVNANTADDLMAYIESMNEGKKIARS